MPRTQEDNDRLTRVGPGTPMGELMRRYWHPVAAVIELDKEPVRKIRLLGEDLILYRTGAGQYGLVEKTCAHRCMSLEYGMPENNGLRCAYHGWLYDTEGNCLEQPYEDRLHPEMRLKDKIKIKAYPVQELGGLIFAYLGPKPVPLLPRWDLLVRTDLDRAIEIHPLPCNWLQCMDNTADPVHFEFLHAGFGNYALRKLGRPAALKQAKHMKIAFDTFPYGFIKRRLVEGETEEASDWAIGHPLIFPTILAAGDEGSAHLHFRVPADDTNTRHFTYWTLKREAGVKPRPTAVKYTVLFDAERNFIGDPASVVTQDMIAWVAQGPISDRTREHLVPSDRGVSLFHNMLRENIERVARGEDPIGVIRNAAENEPMIDIRRGHAAYKTFELERDYSNRFNESQELADIREK